MKDRLVALQILRGLAALMIVIGHATVFVGTAAAVELFFIISGFIMMYVTEKGMYRFFTKRIIRIIPLYWIATAAFVLLTKPVTFSVSYFFKSLFFVNWNNPPILNVGWTLNCEVRFYIIFWLSALISRKYRGLISSAACLVWCGIDFFFFRRAFITPFMPFAFVLGIGGYYLYKLLNGKVTKIYQKILFGALIVLSALWLHSNYADKLVWDIEAGHWSLLRPVVYGVPMLVILLSLLMIVKTDDSKPVKALVYIGDISYSLYLWHIVVQSLLVIFFEKTGYVITPPSTFRFMVLTASVSLFVAHLSYKYLEKPLGDFLKQKLVPPRKS